MSHEAFYSSNSVASSKSSMSPGANDAEIDAASVPPGATLSASKKSHFVDYGPIRIRISRKPALTLSTGRRSKHTPLDGEEALKREERREKNRIAARRLKEKRQSIENELKKEITTLEMEQSELHKYLTELRNQKDRLETELNNTKLQEALDELLNSNDMEDEVLLDELAENFNLWDSLNSDVFDIETILNH